MSSLKDEELRRQYMREWRRNHPEHDRQYRQNHREQIQRSRRELSHLLKVRVMLHYGNGGAVCNRCGNTNIDVLCVDHIKGGGKQHRKELNVEGTNFYQWLEQQEFPLDYQVLCFNCNMIKKLLNQE